MRVTVYLSDNRQLRIADFDRASALDMLEEYRSGVPTLTFDMDGGTVVANTDHVVRIDLDGD